ncbi:TIGR03826 family flagellar region protein [Paenibacillus assamensis]|uniref:TIGR03826 family flagellar region protein n=1 Tax=Paenibacillus assamensis TaxID=311244 RepID=UPI000428E4E9|nr:TIGR03826 family flagellar region protein [Paenibacillus assamensis]
MELSNCNRCGRLFAKVYKDICPNCLKDIEADYKLCADYLRKHRQATMTELSDDTGVSVRQITQFIREGRISVLNMPNLSYPCEVCGGFIQEGHMCESCRRRLLNDLSQAKNETESQANAVNKNSGATYRIIDKA